MNSADRERRSEADRRWQRESGERENQNREMGLLEGRAEISKQVFVASRKGQIGLLFGTNDLVPDNYLILNTLGVSVLSLDIQEQLFSIPVE